VALKAFQGTGAFIAPKLFPFVQVAKPSGQYYKIDPAAWLQVPPTIRAPKTSPRRIEWLVDSDGYAVKNFALAGDLAKEDLAMADNAINLLERTVQNVVQVLQRDMEDRIARLITSISNLGSGVILAGVTKWSDFTNSNPITDVATGAAFIRQSTGLTPNTLALDRDTFELLRIHPTVLDMFKYTAGGLATDEGLKNVFKVDNLYVSDAVKNQAPQAATASIVTIFGNNALLAYVTPEAVGLETATFGLAFRWSPEGIPGAFEVERYDDPDPGKKATVVQVGYYQDEKIVAKSLAYLINATL